MEKTQAFLYWLNLVLRPTRPDKPLRVTIAKAALSPELATIIGIKEDSPHTTFMGVRIDVVPDYEVVA